MGVAEMRDLALDHLADGVIIVDDSGAVRFATPVAAQLMGQSPDRLLGASLGYAFTADQPIEIQVTRAGKSSVCLDLRAREVQVGEERLAVLSLRDVSERRVHEDRLKQAIDRLERSNRDLESFAHVVSHDLREPLRTLSLFAQLLLSRHGGQVSEDGREMMHFIDEGAHRAIQHVEGLLKYCRIGGVAEEWQEVDLNRTLSDVLMDLGLMIADVQGEVAVDPLPRLRGDPIQYFELFLNLIGNALKYRRLDQPPRITVGAVPRDRHWEFSVSDNGRGISQEYTEHVFNLFARLHTHREIPGSGIGLALCRRIVERMGGRIWAESEGPDKGTSIRFRLPAVPQPASE